MYYIVISGPKNYTNINIWNDEAARWDLGPALGVFSSKPCPVVSSDGSKIYLELDPADRNQTNFYVYDIETEELRPLSNLRVQHNIPSCGLIRCDTESIIVPFQLVNCRKRCGVDRFVCFSLAALP